MQKDHNVFTSHLYPKKLSGRLLIELLKQKIKRHCLQGTTAHYSGFIFRLMTSS